MQAKRVITEINTEWQLFEALDPGSVNHRHLSTLSDETYLDFAEKCLVKCTHLIDKDIRHSKIVMLQQFSRSKKL